MDDCPSLLPWMILGGRDDHCQVVFDRRVSCDLSVANQRALICIAFLFHSFVYSLFLAPLDNHVLTKDRDL